MIYNLAINVISLVNQKDKNYDHNKSHIVNSYKCADCDYNGITKTDLKNHMDNHTREKDFSVNKSPVRENTFVSSNKIKGEHSISPEVTENKRHQGGK